MIFDSDIEDLPEIKFSKFRKEESSLNLEVRDRLFLIVVFLDTDGANQFLTIEGFCSAGGGPISVSIEGKSYYYMNSCAKLPKNTFGIKLIDINERHLFTTFAHVNYGNFKFGFSFDSNYLTLNGISF